MGQILYQRPREKLRDRGVFALSNIELIQAIIGSGSLGVSAARLAKTIVTMLEEKQAISYQELLKVKGMGDAKVTQIIASIELGRRFQFQISNHTPVKTKFIHIRQATRRVVEYITINGSGEYIKSRFAIISDMYKTKIAIRKMFADALHDCAGSIVVGVGFRTQTFNVLDNETLEILKMVFDTASLLEIKVNEVWLVNQNSQQSFRRKSI